MEYKKRIVKEDRRALTRGEPRDQNRRINVLNTLVTIVKKVTKEIKSDNLFTGEEVDQQIINATGKINLKVKELELTNENLNNHVFDLTSVIKDKDAVIFNLTEMNNRLSETISKFGFSEKININYMDMDMDIDRPTMDPVFVDPIDINAEEELIPHIVVKNISNEKKEDINVKVNKLKNMLGSLKK